MNTQSRIPSPEAARSAGDMIDQMRGDLIAAETRSAQLEASIREMEEEHRIALEDTRSGYDSEIDELRHRLYVADRLNETQAVELSIARSNSDDHIRIEEKVATIIELIVAAATKANEGMIEVLASKAGRYASVVPDTVDFDPSPKGDEVTVTRLDRRTMLARLANELSPPLAQPEEVLEDERNPHNFPEDDGKPIPRFLGRGPSIVGEDRLS